MISVTVGVDGATVISPGVETVSPSRPRVGETGETTGRGGSALGMPLLVAGSLAFALGVTGYAPVGALVPILLVVVLGEIMAGWVAFRVGDLTQATLFAGFAGFWLTYSSLVLGLTHNWFGVNPADTSRAIAVFVITWLTATLMLTLAALAQPISYLILCILLDIALALLLIGILVGAPHVLFAASVALLVMSAFAAYICLATTGPAPMRRVVRLGPALVGTGSGERVTMRATVPAVENVEPESQTVTEDGSGDINNTAAGAADGTLLEKTETAAAVSAWIHRPCS
jgi:hypothetical protein